MTSEMTRILALGCISCIPYIFCRRCRSGDQLGMNTQFKRFYFLALPVFSPLRRSDSPF